MENLQRPEEDPRGQPHYLVYDMKTNGGAGDQNFVIELYVVLTREHKRFASLSKSMLPPGHRINKHAQKATASRCRT